MEYINFRKTADKNIVLADNISRDEEIHIDKLEKQIVDIQKEIDNIPEPISVADIRDEKVIALIEMHNMEIPDMADLTTNKEVKETFLLQCQNIKESKQWV